MNFKYAPKPIPPLTPEQWKVLEEEMNKPPTEKQKEMWRRAQAVYEAIKPKSSGLGENR